MKRHYNMLTDSPGRTIFLFVLPMIMGNLFQQFYNIIDSVIVGKFVGEEALAAVGASYSVTNVFIAVAIGGGIGSAVIVSQFLGAGQMDKMKTGISTTLINFLFLGVFLGAAGYLLNRRILYWMDTPVNVFKDASLYLKIYFLGLPFLFMYNVQASVFNSLGDSKTPLWLLIGSSFLNIVRDLVFVIYFEWGVAGVAVATVIAQGVSAVFSFLLLMRKMRSYGPEKKHRLYDGGMVFEMLKVAVPSTLQQSIVYIGMLLVQSVINSFGSSVMAGYAAASRIETISIVPMLAIGNAMSTFTAQNMGASKPERVKKGYHCAVIMTAVCALLLCVLLQLGKSTMIQAFLNQGSEPLAYETGVSYVSFISFFFVFMGLKASTDGLLRGAGDVVVFTIANLVNLSIRVFVAFVFASYWGPSAVWFAIPMGWGVNFVISFARYLTGRWKGIRMVQSEPLHDVQK